MEHHKYINKKNIINDSYVIYDITTIIVNKNDLLRRYLCEHYFNYHHEDLLRIIRKGGLHSEVIFSEKLTLDLLLDGTYVEFVFTLDKCSKRIMTRKINIDGLTYF